MQNTSTKAKRNFINNACTVLSLLGSELDDWLSSSAINFNWDSGLNMSGCTVGVAWCLFPLHAQSRSKRAMAATPLLHIVLVLIDRIGNQRNLPHNKKMKFVHFPKRKRKEKV